MKKTADKTVTLQPYLSPLAVWALSVGTAIGWGSLVVTSKSYLGQAGPMGSILGLLIGFVMMVMVASHYHFLANRYPGTGGLYNYVKYIFGYDRAFLVGWFMFLVYVSIFWANATSIPLFARYFLRGIFKVGYLYTLFGYEVYLGEALLTLAAIVLIALLCAKSKKATADAMIVLVLLFTVGITVCFAACIIGRGRTGTSMEPAFIPDKSSLRQVMRIAFISPWAFIGFESVSHSAAEYHFKHGRMFRILVISLIVTTALYIFIILMSVTAYPEGCSGWLDYIRRLDEFDGIAGLPAFYAAYHYLGDTGVYILMAALLSLVLSSMIGMYAPTSDLSTLLGWSLMVFVLITYNKFRAGGPIGYIKGYFEPIPVLLPFNIISEFATPLSMAFRHFGNIASGTVIMGLLRWALANLSHLIFSKLPGALGQVFGNIPILQVGIPAVFSIYFDLFSSCLQAFIFCMLTMMYIGSAAEG